MKDYFKVFEEDEEFLELHSEIMNEINNILNQPFDREYADFLTYDENDTTSTSTANYAIDATKKALKSNDKIEEFITKLFMYNININSELLFSTPLIEFFKDATAAKELMKQLLTFEESHNKLGDGYIRETFGSYCKNKNILDNNFLNSYWHITSNENLMVSSFIVTNHDKDNFKSELKYIKKLYSFIENDNVKLQYMEQYDGGPFLLNNSCSFAYHQFFSKYFNIDGGGIEIDVIYLISRDFPALVQLLNIFTTKELLIFISILSSKLAFINAIKPDSKLSSVFNVTSFIQSYDVNMPVEWNTELLVE